MSPKKQGEHKAATARLLGTNTAYKTVLYSAGAYVGVGTGGMSLLFAKATWQHP